MTLTPEKLYSEIGYIKEDIDNFDAVLNSEPKKDWLSSEKIDGKTIYSLPIEKVEFLLSRFFKNVCFEVIQWSEGAKLAEMTVRVNYIDRDGNKMFQDGVASCVIKGNGMSIAPALKSMAIKDCCHSIGRIFGKDLNRPNTIVKPNKIDLDNVKELFEQKKSILSKEDFEAATRIITEQEVNSYKKLYESLKKL